VRPFLGENGIRLRCASSEYRAARRGYARALYLIYGDDIREGFLSRLQHIARDVRELAPIEVWFYARPLEEAAVRALSGNISLRFR
jgi:hypothetical protein